MSDWLRWALPVFLIAYFGLAFVWPTVRVWKTMGVNPYRFGNSDNAHDFIDRLFRLTLLITSAIILVYAVNPDWYALFLPVAWLQTPVFSLIGLTLLVISLVWTLLAQAQMGQAWRIGIDPAHRTELVQTGVFKISRNPVFLGMRITLLGFFLILPNALSLSALVLGDVLIQIQVRLEEEHLSRLHGDAYRNYLARVRRWL